MTKQQTEVTDPSAKAAAQKANVPFIERPPLTLIAQGVGPEKVDLYIGGTEGARDVGQLQDLGITTVINCAVNLDINYVTEPKLQADGDKRATGMAPIRCYKIGLVDGPGNPRDMLLGGYFILESALSQQIPEKASYPVRDRGHVLVHCRGGRSRSVALVALFLHKDQPERFATLDDAIAHIRDKRDLHPDEWFETPKQVLIDAAEHAANAIDLLRAPTAG
ncbi:Dual specificity phosphatase, catalytic domain [Thalassovita autumnalis]|uniref:Dual specificity phosphatase, catalytic domain n=1 Tax=Thalassovita autumnalis TaxID=2072972 RepID=A0A0P1GBB9_9RHOB|nr:dual specificity protein phosphatase family protein [Thalassovita autumnalis]CUH68904.1 Dual specificity phosphatase, catalytic domain [Thalassovita autumnalis]CUH71436.1 Dual specificity phosphatase, catalytic domain [Thalassovita autumnalis]